MRRIKTTLVFALFALAAIANPYNTSTVVLTTFDQHSFTVRFDGDRYQAQGALELNDLRPGRYRLRIDRRRPSHHGYGGQGRVLFNGFIHVPARSIVQAQVTRNRALRTDVTPMHAFSVQGCQEVNHGQLCADGHLNQGFATELEANECGNQYEGYPIHGYDGVAWTTVMTQMDFTEFRRSLQTMSFETAKLSTVRNQLRFKRFTSAQTRTLMSLFSYDSSKLELAKMMYPTVIDKHRFYLVAEAFTFNSTREELYHFMQI